MENVNAADQKTFFTQICKVPSKSSHKASSRASQSDLLLPTTPLLPKNAAKQSLAARCLRVNPMPSPSP
ncbi:hypothetical protein SESBI_32120 [Sesbania bispinosa]|nr:hypothetical protein SESBI_32120 [Sesbania bispinosa]